jgi:peroxin-10
MQRIFGQRIAHNWSQYCSPFSAVLYHSLTSVAGFQTLGEEYTGILQVDRSGRSTPKKMAVAISVVLLIFGKPTLEMLMNAVTKYVENQSDKTRISETSQIDDNNAPTIALRIQEVLRILKHYMSFLGQLHLALFYLQGTFYHVSKRILGIYYLLVRRSFANHDAASRRILKYLMWISVINSFLVGIKDSISYARIPKTKQTVSDSSFSREDSATTSISSDQTKRCTLCLETRQNPSVTPCGHIFCWDCIMDCLRTKHECPVCREQFPPSRIVPLQNFT